MNTHDGSGRSNQDSDDQYAVRMQGITKRFPGVIANEDVDFEVESGTVHALVGENGAGKTTLMNILYGLFEPTAGTIEIDGDTRSFDSPSDAIDAGIGMIHQHFMLIPPMTVAENLVLGDEPTKWYGLVTDEAQAIEETDRLADRYGFDIDPRERVHEISVGEQQRLEILKALYRGAQTLILDEPTAVLTPQEVESLFEVFDELIADGKTIIFITHKLGEALEAADAISVLRDGKLVGTVASEETDRKELATMMVGREVLMEVTGADAVPGKRTLDVEDLVVEDDRGIQAVDGVSFSVDTGEIFGIAGVDGNGQLELVEAITGLRTPESGRLILDGEDISEYGRQQRIAAGMSYIAEDRQRRSLVMPYDLVRNGLLGAQRLPAFRDGNLVDWEYTNEYTDRVLEEYDVRPRDPMSLARSLSGGNQQKFVVGRELERDPSLLVASQPTRGVDIGSIEFVHNRLLDLRTEGTGILLVSSKLEEVQRLSDRMAVMYEGQFMDVVDPETVTEAEVGLLMAGEYPDGYQPQRDQVVDRTVDSGAENDGPDGLEAIDG